MTIGRLSLLRIMLYSKLTFHADFLTSGSRGPCNLVRHRAEMRLPDRNGAVVERVSHHQDRVVSLKAYDRRRPSAG